ncbi:MAG TPA: ATP-binding protein [Acidimicrobiia bacterium]|nr:ATP-binding protein [Acidimicrobiia bacterium]
MSLSAEAARSSRPGIRRGTLRVYLGAAPGVGKTYAMLNEGRRAKARGADIVIGYVEPHGRRLTAEQCGDLEIVPRRVLTYRGASLEEFDLDAVLRRHPERVLVDELAHTNVPGSRNEKRWQDVEVLLDAGIDVISTVNIQHLESLNDVVERITGVNQGETIPDEIVRDADQVELVDQTPEALRRRMAHGNVYAPDQIDAALTNYFREGNLAALRELALLWVADQVDEGLEHYRERHGITEPWETRERVVVAVTGAPGTDALIRRAARIAQRQHGDLVGVHVLGKEGLSDSDGGPVSEHRKLLEQLGGEYHEVVGSDVGAALVDFARAENATQLVVGASQRSRWSEFARGSVINRVVRLSGSIDVHVISHQRRTESAESPAGERRLGSRSAVSTRRRLAGWSVAVIGLPLLTILLTHMRASVGLPSVLLLYLSLVVAVAAIGGTGPAIAAAVAAFLLANWYFTPPFHHWTVSKGENVVALSVFLGVAIVVSWFVDAAARRASEATRARTNAANMARMAATMGEADPLPALLAHLRSAFGLVAVALLVETDRSWRVVAADGDPIPSTPDRADIVEDVAPGTVLALAGGPVAAEEQAVLKAFAAQLGVVLEHTRLRAEAGRAEALAEANQLRSALLQAVSHDLRTPLASIKASASSLRQHDVEWSEQDVDDFLDTINDETDRLTKLVENLLSMSRINAGVLTPSLRIVALEEVVPAAISSLGSRASLVDVRLSETLPAVLADPALLERVLANIIENAVRASPPGQAVVVEGATRGDAVDVLVVDRGPGIPRELRAQAFEPFQRLGDQQQGTGVGLGLAVARGFTSAMGGTLEIDDTPGGGTTMRVTLPIAP